MLIMQGADSACESLPCVGEVEKTKFLTEGLSKQSLSQPYG